MGRKRERVGDELRPEYGLTKLKGGVRGVKVSPMC